MPDIGFVLDGEIVDPVVQALFAETRDQLSQKQWYQTLGYTDYEPNVPEEKLSSVSGYGAATLTVAGQSYGSDARYKGYAVTLALRKYTKELAFAEEDLHWILKSGAVKRQTEFRDVVEGAAHGLYQSVDVDAAKIFYLAHGTTFFTGGDAVALASGAHPIRKPGSSNESNLFASGETQEAFSASSLVKAIERMDRFRLNDNTQMMPCTNLLVVCSSELADTVDRTIVSEYGPDTANLGVNAASKQSFGRRGKTISYVVSPYQPYSYRNYWAVIDVVRAARMLYMAWAWRPRIGKQQDARKGVFYNEGSVNMAPIVRDWRFGHFSIGNGAAI